MYSGHVHHSVSASLLVLLCLCTSELFLEESFSVSDSLYVVTVTSASLAASAAAFLCLSSSFFFCFYFFTFFFLSSLLLLDPGYLLVLLPWLILQHFWFRIFPAPRFLVTSSLTIITSAPALHCGVSWVVDLQLSHHLCPLATLADLFPLGGFCSFYLASEWVKYHIQVWKRGCLWLFLLLFGHFALEKDEWGKSWFSDLLVFH